MNTQERDIEKILQKMRQLKTDNSQQQEILFAAMYAMHTLRISALENAFEESLISQALDVIEHMTYAFPNNREFAKALFYHARSNLENLDK